MRLHYLTKDGKTNFIELTEKPLTIGRSADADVLILDEKASRVHCGIRFWDGEFFIKDLKSKNGTFVNDARVDIHQLNPGDRVRVGATMFIFEQAATTGTDTALTAMQDAFNGGKGYSTILREIVHETDPPASPMESVTAADAAEDGANDAAPTADDSDDPSKTVTTRKRVVLGSNKSSRAPLKRKPLQVRVRKSRPAEAESDPDPDPADD